MQFTQHYAGSPVCAPSGCVLLICKHTDHAYVRGNMQAEPSGQLPIPEDELNFSMLLQEKNELNSFQIIAIFGNYLK